MRTHFIITGRSKEVLEEIVKPIVENFLSKRGLVLSQEKTKIVHVKEGFDFLGVNTRKYKNGNLFQKPAKDSIKRFMTDIKETIKRNKAVKTEILIRLLNPKITGWANYYRHYCSKQTFGYINHHLFPPLWRWARNRHQRKGARWVAKKYFRNTRNRRWQFSISHTPIRRHVKIKSDATPYDPAYEEYFRVRQARRKEKRLFSPCKSSWSPWWDLKFYEN